MRMPAMVVLDVTPRQRSGQDWLFATRPDPWHNGVQAAGVSSRLMRIAPRGSPG